MERSLALNIGLLGDSGVGRTVFLCRWEGDYFNWTGHVFRYNYQGNRTHEINGKQVNVCLLEGDLQFYLPMSSVLLVSFCVKSPISFANIKEKWIPEVRHRCPNTPVLLVGLQCDLFNSERHVFTPEIEINGDYPVPREDALQLAKDIGAVGYYQTSAFTGAGVMEAMDACMRVGLTRAGISLTCNEERRRRFVLPWKRRSQSSDQSSDPSSDQLFYTNANGPLIPPPPKPPTNEVPDIKIQTSTFNAEWVKTINNPSHSDVIFRLEGKTYHAHRYVLASASDLFRQLLGVTKKVKIDKLCDGWDKARLKKVTRKTVNSGQLEGMLHIEERPDSDGKQLTEMTFDPSVVTELALSRALTFLYTGVVELDKESEGFDETIKISQLLNLPELELMCENARKGDKSLNKKIATWLNNRIVSVTKQLFLNKGLFSDVCFLVEGVVVPAHRLVLTTRCEVMSVMLSGAFQESTANKISIPDISLDTFLSFLEYLYTDYIPYMKNYIGILELANRYLMSRLVSLCEYRISWDVERATKNSISKADVDIIIGLLLSSQLHNASQLSNLCLHVISSNYDDFERSEQFLQLDQDNLSYVEEHRWPPLSYETDMNEYKAKYLNTETEGEESGDPSTTTDDPPRTSDNGAAVQSHKRRGLSRLFKQIK